VVVSEAIELAYLLTAYGLVPTKPRPDESAAAWDTGGRGEVVLDNEWITIWYHPEVKIVHHQVHKAMRGQAFRTAISKGTETLLKYGATKWLSDDRHHYVLPQEDQEWSTTVWFPATQQAGWKFWAIVKPERAVADLYLRRLAAGWSALGVVTELFTKPEPGFLWLKGVDQGSASPIGASGGEPPGSQRS
jgi:hypothetical protein